MKRSRSARNLPWLLKSWAGSARGGSGAVGFPAGCSSPAARRQALLHTFFPRREESNSSSESDSTELANIV